MRFHGMLAKVEKHLPHIFCPVLYLFSGEGPLKSKAKSREKRSPNTTIFLNFSRLSRTLLNTTSSLKYFLIMPGRINVFLPFMSIAFCISVIIMKHERSLVLGLLIWRMPSLYYSSWLVSSGMMGLERACKISWFFFKISDQQDAFPHAACFSPPLEGSSSTGRTICF